MQTQASAPPRRSRSLLRPWLVCVDLQREYVVPGRPLYADDSAQVAQAAIAVLEHARAFDWRILHTQVRRPFGLFSDVGAFAHPIEGSRPRVSEPVFFRAGLSAFSHPEFGAELAQAEGEDIFLVGFSLSHTCLATALAAHDAGLTLTLVEDAIGDAPWEGQERGDAGNVASAILKPFVHFTHSSVLLAEDVMEPAP